MYNLMTIKEFTISGNFSVESIGSEQVAYIGCLQLQLKQGWYQKERL